MEQGRKFGFILLLGLLGVLLFAVLSSCRGENNNDDVISIEPGGSIHFTVLFQGVGLPDVTLSLNSGPTLTTASDGKCTLGFVPQGTYTIIPSKSGYLFTPNSAAVTIDFYSDSKEVDFTAIRVP
jgi:hypothetical protein